VLGGALLVSTAVLASRLRDGGYAEKELTLVLDFFYAHRPNAAP